VETRARSAAGIGLVGLVGLWVMLTFVLPWAAQNSELVRGQPPAVQSDTWSMVERR
jgi:hypothetical protein